MLRCMHVVLIGAQQNELVPDAKLRDDCVDCANLHTRPAACVSKACRGNMVFTVWLDQRQRRETLHYLRARLGAREALQQLLQDEASGNDDVCTGERLLQCLNRGFLDLNVSS